MSIRNIFEMLRRDSPEATEIREMREKMRAVLDGVDIPELFSLRLRHKDYHETLREIISSQIIPKGRIANISPTDIGKCLMYHAIVVLQTANEHVAEGGK